MLHNHPSGSLIPSEKDIAITDRLKMVCDLIDVNLLDHIIVGRGREYFSFQEKNILPTNSIRLNRNLEEVDLGKNISESRVSTMERLKEAQIDARLVLQVHDELIVEAHRDVAKKAREILVEEMEGAAKLRVALLVEAATGANWYDTH